jgi:hypothetical protein
LLQNRFIDTTSAMNSNGYGDKKNLGYVSGVRFVSVDIVQGKSRINLRRYSPNMYDLR